MPCAGPQLTLWTALVDGPDAVTTLVEAARRPITARSSAGLTMIRVEEGDEAWLPADLAQSLRKGHGSVRSKDVGRALKLLERAGLARIIDGTWAVAWDELGGRSKDLPQKLAERACKRSKSGTIVQLLKKERRADAPERVPTLFDEI